MALCVIAFAASEAVCNCDGFVVWNYNRDTGKLECPDCKIVNFPKGYTGYVKDKATGRLMRFYDGELCKGWMAYVDDSYYFGEDGVAVTGQQVIDGKSYTFDSQGRFVKGAFVDEAVVVDGETRIITRYYIAGGIFATRWMEIDGHIYYFSKPYDYQEVADDGAMYRGGTFTIRTAGKNSLRAFTFDVNGRLVGGCWEDEKELDGSYVGTRYYWGPNYVTGERVIDGFTYSFDDQGFLATKSISVVEVKAETPAANPKEPPIVVTDGENKLVKDTHYTLVYENNNDTCTGIIKITGIRKRGYTGTKRTEFVIGHKKTVNKMAVAPTCTKEGYTSGVYCEYCGKWASGHEKIPAKGHSLTEATCTEAKKCTVCGKVDGKALGHKEEVIPAVPATYTEKGLTSGKKCTVCGVVTKKQKTVEKKELSKVKNLNVKSTATNQIKLSWSKVTDAEGYKVYYSTNGKNWKSAKTSKTTYTVKGLKSGTSYQFKVAAYVEDVVGAASSTVKTATKVSAVTLSSVKSSKAKVLTVNWKTVNGASGYVVEYSTSKNFTSKTTKKVTLKKGSDKKATIKSLKSGKKYYVRVKAYKTVNGKAVYGTVSNVK